MNSAGPRSRLHVFMPINPQGARVLLHSKILTLKPWLPEWDSIAPSNIIDDSRGLLYVVVFGLQTHHISIV